LGLEDKKVLLFVGSSFKRKGLLFVLDVLKCLPKEFVLLVVGKGKIEKKLLRGLEKRIYFLGPQRKIEIASKNQEIMGKMLMRKRNFFL